MQFSLAIIALSMGIAYCHHHHEGNVTHIEASPGHPVVINVKRQAPEEPEAAVSTNTAPRKVTVIEGYHIKYLLNQCNQRNCYNLCKDNWCSTDCQQTDAVVPATGNNGQWCHCYKGGKNAACDRDACGRGTPGRNQVKSGVTCGRCNNACANDNYCYGTCYNYNQQRMGSTCTCYTGDKCGQCPFGNAKRSIFDSFYGNMTTEDTTEMITGSPEEDATTQSMPSSATSEDSLMPNLFGPMVSMTKRHAGHPPNGSENGTSPMVKRNVLVSTIYDAASRAISNSSQFLDSTSKQFQMMVAAALNNSTLNNGHLFSISEDEPMNITTNMNKTMPNVSENVTSPLVKRNIIVSLYDIATQAISNSSQFLDSTTKQFQTLAAAALNNSTLNNGHLFSFAEDEPMNMTSNATKTMSKRNAPYYQQAYPQSAGYPYYRQPARPVAVNGEQPTRPVAVNVAQPSSVDEPSNPSAAPVSSQAALAKGGTAANVDATANFGSDSRFIGVININNANGTVIFTRPSNSTDSSPLEDEPVLNQNSTLSTPY